MPHPTSDTTPYLLEGLEGLERITAPPAPAVSSSDAIHLVVIRESTKYDASVLHGMSVQILTVCERAGVQGASEMLAACGEGPKSFLPWARTPDGEAWRAQHRGRTLYEPEGRAYGYILQVAGTHFLLAATSATTEAKEDLSNPFTSDLIRLVDQLGPDHLWTGPPSRLMRRRDHATQLHRTVSRNRVIVHTQLGEFDFRAQRQAADAQWQTAADYSHREVQSILQRTTLGRIHAVRSGRWPEGEAGVPAIHLSLDRDRRLVVDDSATTKAITSTLVGEAVKAVRAGEDLTPAVALRIAKAISDVGARSADSHHRRVDQMADPQSAITTRLRYVQVAAAGRYDRLHKLPVDDWTEQELLVPVYRHPDGGNCVVLSSTFPALCETYDHLDRSEVAVAVGWIDRVLRESAPSSIREDRLPLGDVRVVVDGARKGCIRSMTRDGSRYVVREHADGTPVRGKGVDSRIVASLPWGELHGAVVDGIAEAAASDRLPLDDALLQLPPEVDLGPSPEERDLHARHARLDQQISELNDKAKGLDAALAEQVRDAVEPRVKVLEAEQNEIADELASLEAARTTDETATESTVTTLADLLALLEVTGPMPPRLRQLVRRHIAELRITPAGDGTAKVQGSVRLQLPAGDGLPRITAPIPWEADSSRKGYLLTGEVDADGNPVVRRDRKQRIEHPAALHRRLTEEVTTAEVLDTNDEKRARRHLLATLTASSKAYGDRDGALQPAMASALLDAGPLSTRQAVYSLLGAKQKLPWQGVTWPDGSLPQPPATPKTIEGLSRAKTHVWLEHLRLTYVDTEAGAAKKGTGWSRGGERLRRSIIKALQAAGGQMPADELRRRLNLRRSIRTAASARSAFRRYEMLEIHGPTEAPTVRLRPCPWGCKRTEWQPLNVPEVPGGLICRGCRRSPELADVTFPKSYLLEWEGPSKSSRDRTDQRPDNAVGTNLAVVPARAVAAVRQTPVPQAATSEQCTFVPHPEDGACGSPATSGRWCPDHDHRNKRQRAKTRAKVERRTCSADGCDGPIVYPGSGRPPSRCPDHHVRAA